MAQRSRNQGQNPANRDNQLSSRVQSLIIGHKPVAGSAANTWIGFLLVLNQRRGNNLRSLNTTPLT